jgi:phage gpG-like protein
VDAEVARQTESLLALAKRKVSGRVLRNVTSTLMRKLNARLELQRARAVGLVGIKLTYAAAHEFGFEGTVQVKEHDRRPSGAVPARPMVRNELIKVKAHARRMLMPKRSYLRSSLAERRETIIAAIQAAAQRGANGRDI